MFNHTSVWPSLSLAILDLFLFVGIQTLLIVAVSLGLEALCRSAKEKRWLWRSAMVLLMVILLAELLGAGSWLHDKPVSGVPVVPLALRQVDMQPLAQKITPLSLKTPDNDAAWSMTDNRKQYHLGVIMGLVWISITTVLLLALIFVHLLLGHLRRRLLPLMIPGQTARIRSLAGQMGIRKSLRMGYRSGTQTPFVFGLCQPTLVMPGEFPVSLTARHQEAVILHELAHLADRDPQWQLLADLLIVLLWWHPASWILRRRWRRATESAADEVTLQMVEGPILLAECLLVWQKLPRQRGWLPGLSAVSRSTSWLSQRINELLRLAAVPVAGRNSRLFSRGVRTSLLALVVMMVMIGAGSARLHTVKEDEPMVGMKVLRHSVLGLAFLAATEVTAPAQGQVVKGGGQGPRSVVAAGKSEDGAVLAAGFTQAELAQFKTLLQERARKVAAYQQEPDSPAHREAGKAIGAWYRESLKNFLTPEHFSRYMEYWEFNHVAINFNQAGDYTISVSPHPFDADPNVFKGVKLTEEQNTRLAALRKEIAKSYQTMNEVVQDPKGLGAFDAAVSRLHQTRNNQLQTILSAEQYQQYRAAINGIIDARLTALARSGTGTGIAAPIK